MMRDLVKCASLWDLLALAPVCQRLQRCPPPCLWSSVWVQGLGKSGIQFKADVSETGWFSC